MNDLARKAGKAVWFVLVAAAAGVVLAWAALLGAAFTLIVLL